MKNGKLKTITKKLKPLNLMLWFCVFSFSFLIYLLSPTCLAVTTNVTRHSSSADLMKGDTEDVVVDSRGNLQLGRSAETLVESLDDVWSINSIVVSAGTIFVGTSPNGGIYKYGLGKLEKIYPPEAEGQNAEEASDQPSDTNTPGDANSVKADKYLANEHIFAMATDVAGRLLAAVSGEKCLLLRFEADRMEEPEIVFEPNDAKYIFAIAIDNGGDIYLGTGPEGKLYKLDSFGREPQLIYDSTDKNILSLAIGTDGFVYAGSDTRGLVYRIDPRSRTATVLYDSEQPEITALLFAENDLRIPYPSEQASGPDLYAAATLAEITQTKAEFAPQLPLAGRPETKTESPESPGQSNDGLKLEIANTKEKTSSQLDKEQAPARKPPKPAKASYIYRITKDGYVTNIFSEAAVFFCLTQQDNKLLIGTGNSGRTFAVDPASEQQEVIYEHQQASQITAMAVDADDLYLGTANAPKLIKLTKTFASEGIYTSDLIDAGQPSRWGKLQIEADIPRACKVLVSSRSGNVKDVNDSTFSDWTELTEITEPMQLRCPPGRFCQYKLVLHSTDGKKSPVIREIAVANTVPNLAPKVESVSVGRLETTGKAGTFKISYKAKDENNDKLIYKIDFRKIPRTNWIQLKDELEADTFEWDGRTIEDGRYEVRVTASDQRSNTTTTKLTGSRISEPVVVDNTPPVIENYYIEKDDKTVTLTLQVADQLSALEKVDYTIDSNAEWMGTLPDDSVFDTTEEDFTIVIEDLDVGEHVIAVRVGDNVGNTVYKTFDVNIGGS